MTLAGEGSTTEVRSTKLEVRTGSSCSSTFIRTSSFVLRTFNVGSVVRDRLVGARAGVAHVGLAEAAQDADLQGCVDQDLAGEAGVRREVLLAGEAGLLAR